MIILIPIVTVVLCAVSFMLLLRDTKDNRAKEGLSSTESVVTKSMLIYSVIMVIVTVAASVLFCTIYKDNSLLTSVKRMSLLCVLWPIAYIDIKSYRIPNVFIILGLSCRVIIFPFELIFENNGVWMILLSEIIAAAALFIAAVLCTLCIKNSIGYGDIKLFIVMGLLLGLTGIWSAIFLSLIVSFVVSVYFLITKKKGRKDLIPFGPALVIGTYLSVCLSGM